MTIATHKAKRKLVRAGVHAGLRQIERSFDPEAQSKQPAVSVRAAGPPQALDLVATDRQLEYCHPDLIKPYPKNARIHTKKQLRQLCGAYREFGVLSPILVDENYVVLAGHGRLLAAKALELKTVPIIRVLGLSDAKKRAFRLADNKLALNASWDEELLLEEIKVLTDTATPIDLDSIGFSVAEVDGLVGSVTRADAGDDGDHRLPAASGKQRCRRGDLWQAGPHRLMCGDARDREAIDRLMAGKRARMVFTDPPYNLAIEQVSGLGKIKHSNFAMGSGEMSPADFVVFLRNSFDEMIHHSVDGSIHFVCIDWRHVRELLEAGGAYTGLKNLVVWVKDNGGMGSFYRSRHELVFVFKNGTAPHLNTFELGQHGRYRTNVWEYRGMNSASAARGKALALHPTVKPVAMVADAIRDVSARGDIVLDPFGGSGSTLIAAHKTGRRAYLCEIDPLYCDRILQRWETYAHDDAVLIERES